MIALQYLWLMLPAFVANIMPVFFRRANFLNYPVDFGLMLNKKRLLGDNKTFRGFFFGVAFGVLVFYAQKVLYGYYPFFKELSLFDYSSVSLLVGFLISFGALFGDSVKSFFKRQLDILPGQAWPPFDQVDYAIGAVVFSSPFIGLSFFDCVGIVVLSGSLHLLTTVFGYYIGLRKKKW